MQRMASRNTISLALMIIAAALFARAMATEHWVGDSSGWTVDFNYTAWASNRVFRVGDTLVFNYTPGHHNVFKVDGAGFKDCIIPSSNEGALTTGHDVIPLKTTGKKWYICGVEKHCAKRNMKLVINVLDSLAPAPTPIPYPPPSPNTPSNNNAASYGIFWSKFQVLVTSVAALALFFIY